MTLSSTSPIIFAPISVIILLRLLLATHPSLIRKGSIIVSKEIAFTYGRYFSFYHLGGTVWLVVYRGDTNPGRMMTLNINSDGTFGSVIDTRRFETGIGAFPNLTHVSGDVFAIAYTGPDSDGWLKTWQIQSDGTIAAAMIDSLEFDGVYCHSPAIRPISGDVFAIAYQGDQSGTGRGYIKTVDIDSAGNIGSVIDTFMYAPTRAGSVSPIVPVAGEVYAIAYSGVDDDGFIATVTIHDDGQIDEPVVDQEEIDTQQFMNPDLIYIGGDTYAVAYTGVDNDGFLLTVKIVVKESSGGGNTALEMVRGAYM